MLNLRRTYAWVFPQIQPRDSSKLFQMFTQNSRSKDTCNSLIQSASCWLSFQIFVIPGPKYHQFKKKKTSLEFAQCKEKQTGPKALCNQAQGSESTLKVICCKLTEHAGFPDVRMWHYSRRSACCFSAPCLIEQHAQKVTKQHFSYSILYLNSLQPMT